MNINNMVYSDVIRNKNKTILSVTMKAPFGAVMVEDMLQEIFGFIVDMPEYESMISSNGDDVKNVLKSIITKECSSNKILYYVCINGVGVKLIDGELSVVDKSRNLFPTESVLKDFTIDIVMIPLSGKAVYNVNKIVAVIEDRLDILESLSRTNAYEQVPTASVADRYKTVMKYLSFCQKPRSAESVNTERRNVVNLNEPYVPSYLDDYDEVPRKKKNKKKDIYDFWD